jgi:hypothetical protein
MDRHANEFQDRCCVRVCIANFIDFLGEPRNHARAFMDTPNRATTSADHWPRRNSYFGVLDPRWLIPRTRKVAIEIFYAESVICLLKNEWRELDQSLLE